MVGCERYRLCLVVIVSVGQVAAAADDPKKLFETATAEFNLGHYEKAAAMYEEIYKVTLEPVLLYNIAQAHRLGGDFDKAVFFYRGYLRAQPQAKNHGEVQRRIAELDEAIAAEKRRGQERPPNAPVVVEPRTSRPRRRRNRRRRRRPPEPPQSRARTSRQRRSPTRSPRRDREARAQRHAVGRRRSGRSGGSGRSSAVSSSGR